MERLTRRNECGQALFAKSVNWDEHPIVAVLDKLAEYEDTGLKPQQLNHLKQENAAMKRLLKLAMEDIRTAMKFNYKSPCSVCSYYDKCHCDGICTIEDELRKWRYADEVKELIDNENELDSSY